MSMIGEAFVRLRSDDTLYKPEVRRQVQGATRDVERATREFGRFGRGTLVGTGALNQLGRAAAFASLSFVGGAGLIVGIRNASEAASNLNEQIARSNEIFGRSADSIEEWAQTSASSLLLARDQAIAFASDFGTILVGLGQARQQAATTSQALVQLGADLASFSNVPVADALAAIRSGLVGEIEPLRRLGVVLSEAEVSQKALTLSGKESVAALTAQEKVQARLNLIFEKTAIQQGDVARTAGSLANQQRQLSANIRNLSISLGEALNPEINRVITGLNEWLSDTDNQERAQKEFQQAVRDGTAIVEGFANGLSTIHGILSPLISAVGGLTKAIELLLIAMAVSKIGRFTGALTLMGTEAGIATGRVNLLRGALVRLGTLAVIPIAIDFVINRENSVVGKALTTETAGGQVPGARGSPFPKGTNLNDAWQAALDEFIESGSLRGLDASDRAILDEVRAGLIPGQLTGAAFTGREPTLIERLRLAVAAAGLTPGTGDDVRALTAQREQFKRSLDFALQQIELGVGNTKEFALEAERLSGEIAAINTELAAVAKDNADKAETARLKAIEALIPDRLSGTLAGFDAASRAFIAARIGGVTGGQAETDALAALGQAQSIASLRRQIAETRGKTEEELVPFLERERDAITEQIRILRLTGADKAEILQAVLEQARIDKRIADVRRESASFTAQDLFSLAAGEFAALGSNVGAIDVALSPQEAGGAAVRAARSVSVNQHFYGQQPNPAQALQQASQAARALR